MAPASKGEALQREIAKAKAIEKDPKTTQDQVDAWLRVASMALDAGRPDCAREVLASTTDKFASLTTDKQFSRRETVALQAVGGKEQEKYFLGDPFEQMMAYFYLGLLDFQAGQYDWARADFQNASLADAGSKDEAFRSDSHLVMLMEGVAALRMGDVSLAEEAFRFARQAFAFRTYMPVVSRAMYRSLSRYAGDEGGKQLQYLDKAFPLIYEHIPMAVYNSNDPRQGIEEAFQAARASVEAPEKDAAAKAFLKAYSGRDSKEASKLLDTMRENVLASLSEEELGLALASIQDFDGVIETCQDPQTNVFVIYQAGQGPVKIREGKYGQTVKVRSTPDPVSRLAAFITPAQSSAPLFARVAMPAESVAYQAETRGGRPMDHILEGRAQFRDAMNVTSAIAMTATSAALTAAVVATTAMVTTTVTTVTATTTAAGGVAYTTTTTTTTGAAGAAAAGPALIVAGVAFLIYKGAKALADATHPEGDIRGWHELPARFYFFCGQFEPGTYEFQALPFDTLGEPITQQRERVQFDVVAERPSLVLCGSPWF